MNDLLQQVIQGSDFQKALFLMVTGVGFVFLVQLVFYLVIKIFLSFFNRKEKRT
jgi:Na+-transporting methylmalonyl-CoA/oxaloacetate decarboxylase gamma subunit